MSQDRINRRDFVVLAGPAAMLSAAQIAAAKQVTAPPHALADGPASAGSALKHPDPRRSTVKVRTLTAGVQVRNAADSRPIEAAITFLAEARRRFTDAGFEVQTLRIATNSFLRGASSQRRSASTAALLALDRQIAAAGVLLSIGPIQSRESSDDELAAWVIGLIQHTHATSLSVCVATPEGGVDAAAIRSAGAIILALAPVLPGGAANFRFAAAANVPAGTPFFPAAWHEGEISLSVGLETPNLIHQIFTDAPGPLEATQRLRSMLDIELTPVEKIASELAQEHRYRYLGIDSSPAPGSDSSIGAAIEALTGVPFGAPSTLQACAAITGAIKSLRVKTCGYSGLMLPILEDPVLAARAAEGRISVSQLLLYSSVCGTGLDVVPLAGNTQSESLRAIIGDVATMAVRLRKPLSARLFPIPGRLPGDTVSYDDPLLFSSRVLGL